MSKEKQNQEVKEPDLEIVKKEINVHNIKELMMMPGWSDLELLFRREAQKLRDVMDLREYKTKEEVAIQVAGKQWAYLGMERFLKGLESIDRGGFTNKPFPKVLK